MGDLLANPKRRRTFARSLHDQLPQRERTAQPLQRSARGLSILPQRAREVGDRNLTTLRIPAYFVLDAGLSKSFKLPYAEGHALQFRWEVFNVTNTQPFGVFAICALSLQPEPFAATAAPPHFGRYSGLQTPVGEPRPGRVKQFALRYSF